MVMMVVMLRGSTPVSVALLLLPKCHGHYFTFTPTHLSG